MSTVVVQLGQCGNQLGWSLLDKLYEELYGGQYDAASRSMFFQEVQGGDGKQETRVARAVLIDLEPKVVKSVQSLCSTGGWRYPEDSWLCYQGGAGNNWAQGHCRYGPLVESAALNLIRKQMEQCDGVDGILLVQSAAGGTGAGLGTAIAESLRDHLGSTHLVNCCVW